MSAAPARYGGVAIALANLGLWHGAHVWLAWSMMVLLALHLGAAARHHLVLRDRLLARMGVGAL